VVTFQNTGFFKPSRQPAVRFLATRNSHCQQQMVDKRNAAMHHCFASTSLEDQHKRGSGQMLSQLRGSDLDGSPLAVCVNDCQIDCGQPFPELMRVCFQVGCAFAEMRWGTQAPPLTKPSVFHYNTASAYRQSDV
jgi:hypothetical protein